MSKRIETVFKESSSAKDFIRSRIDREVIKSFKDQYYPDQQLSYLGLPGQYLLDILSWREFLGHATAIEGIDNEDIKQDLRLCVMKNRLERMVEIIYGDIDDILRLPGNPMTLSWPYHICNLDYCGGLVNKTDENISNRLEAIRSLIVRQEGHPFLLFLTLNLRDDDKGEMDVLLDEMEIGLDGSNLKSLEECFNAHREQGHAGRLKFYVPIFLMNNSHKFQFHFHPPILYQGTKQMMHFAIQLTPYQGLAAGRIIFPDDYVRILNTPLLLSHEADDLRIFHFPKVEIISQRGRT